MIQVCVWVCVCVWGGRGIDLCLPPCGPASTPCLLRACVRAWLQEWYAIVEGDHALWRGVSDPYKYTIRAFLVQFHTAILAAHGGQRFSFKNGSVGEPGAGVCVGGGWVGGVGGCPSCAGQAKTTSQGRTGLQHAPVQLGCRRCRRLHRRPTDSGLLPPSLAPSHGTAACRPLVGCLPQQAATATGPPPPGRLPPGLRPPPPPPAGNFFFAGARMFFHSLEAAVFLFARVARLPEGSHVLPSIATEERIMLGAELEDGSVLRGQNQISHPPAAGGACALAPGWGVRGPGGAGAVGGGGRGQVGRADAEIVHMCWQHWLNGGRGPSGGLRASGAYRHDAGRQHTMVSCMHACCHAGRQAGRHEQLPATASTRRLLEMVGSR